MKSVIIAFPMPDTQTISLHDFANRYVESLPMVPCECRMPGAGGGSDHIVFSIENLPTPPAILMTPQLAIATTQHHYGSSIRIDALHFYATPNTYRELGVLLLACVFHLHDGGVVINLSNPQSKIKHLEIGFNGLSHGAVWEYLKRPLRFTYHPEIPEHRPNWPRRDDYLPQFGLEFSRENKAHPVIELDKRDVAEISSEDDGLVLLAELLLNIGLPNPDAPIDSVELEGFPGHRKVREWSAEAHFHLPGSNSWPGEYPVLGEPSIEQSSPRIFSR